MLLQKSKIYERNIHKIYFFILEERLNVLNYFLMRRIEVCEKLENYFYERCNFDDYYDLYCNYCEGCCDWGTRIF